MRKLLTAVVFIVVVAIFYSIFTDPKKRDEVLGTIESSTGVDLDAPPEKILEDAGRAMGSATDKLLKGLGDTLTDPELHKSLKRWGEDALEHLDQSDLDRLKRDLKKEANRGSADYDAIFEKYFGALGGS